MNKAIQILGRYAEYQWRWTPWCAVFFAVGVIAALLVTFCKSFKVKDPWKVYLFALLGAIVFATQFFGTAIPTQRDANAENIIILEGTYHGIVPGSGKGSRSPMIEIELANGIDARRYLADSFVAGEFSYDPCEYFPENGPLTVRVYCAGRTGRALYMEIIGGIHL